MVELFNQDDFEDYCEGDTPIEEIDWDEVNRLQRLQKEALDSDDVQMAMLGLLHEMYGQDLKVL